MRRSRGATGTPEPLEFDVIVVGHGAAGAATAIEAADRGARVLIIDRAYGGGASALSGGVVYAGGGTPYQCAEGYDDPVEEMYRYLARETGDAVSPETLRRFCDTSVEMIAWLEEQGVRFAGGVPGYKTSYPTDEHYLYHSGNEKAYPYCEVAAPAPRGHRALAKGLSSGKAMWTALAESAAAKGVDVITAARVEELVLDGPRVVGVRFRTLDPHSGGASWHRRLLRWGGKIGNWMPPIGRIFTDRADALWQRRAEPLIARAGAVVLAAGGFIHNAEWVRQHAPQFVDISPLGTPGDDGAGIRLGQAAGGATGAMGNVTAWRFLTPPSALLEGIAVGQDGARIANEDLYGAAHGDVMMRRHGGRGWLVCDAATWQRARAQLRTQTQSFQLLQLVPLFTFGFRKAATLERLAVKMGVDVTGLRSSVDAYNDGVRSGVGDPFHKAPEYCAPIERGPFYSIDISAKNVLYYPLPGLTLGGLIVDEMTGGVLREDGTPIDGLYAAGRNAVGICANGYVSGLSLADCVFSGRRAGEHASVRAARAVAD
ncbi:FAD-binding protein [Microbacterium sp. zg-Y818]|uniref:FAD-binding protein n=1 Tax=unclassified Microbacterium TaxID=2609290 RepID=UPI00214AC85E|nr:MULTISPECIES: FAD-binding protein [unclassified Microbacterium]MCR2799384.1 FAD-binding protein [Microbacterium sp. zg.Y818]WIM21383.1 FAD-binding protein [Microbacterium sp. zg-Y818]